MDNDHSVCFSKLPMCPPALHFILAGFFSGSEVKSAIESFPDDETGSFLAVHLDLTGEGSEMGGLYEDQSSRR